MKAITNFLTLMLILTATCMFSQVTVTMNDMQYQTGGNINNGTPIEIPSGGNITINFVVDLSKPTSQATSGNIKFYYKKNSSPSVSINIGSVYSICSTCWFSGNPETYSVSSSLNLYASYFNNSEGVIYAKYESNTGVDYKSSEWNVEVKSGPITNNTISGNQTINSGQTASELSGSSPNGGNGSYTYQWQKKINNSWSNISGSTSRDFSPGVLTNTTEYRRVVGSAGQTSTSNSVTVTVTNYPDIINNSISENQTIVEGSSPNLLLGTTPTGGNGSYQYIWQSKTTGSWSNINDSNNKNYQPTILDETTYFRRKVRSASLVSYSNQVEINVTPLPEITNNSFYFNGNTTLIGSTPSGGNGSYEYLWQIMAYGVDDTPNYYGNTKSVNTIPSNELIFYYRRRVKSYNNVSYTNWKTKNGLLGNNTISFNGNNKIKGSLPTGGINSYKYNYYLSINVFGELEDSFINTTRDLNLPPFYLYAMNNIPGTKIIVTRVVKSGMESISNTIEINSSFFKNILTQKGNKVEDLGSISYNLYPNPIQSNEVISFETNLKPQNQNVEMFFHSTDNVFSSFKLKKQLTGRKVNFKLPELDSGIYLYNILIEGKSIKKGKIIVTK